MNSILTSIRRLSILHGLAGAGLFFTVGVLIAATLTFAGYRSVAIGGQNYERIREGQDLLSDVLPPPLYIVETYLEINLIAAGDGDLQKHIDRIFRLRKDNDERLTHWLASGLPQDIKAQISVASNEAAGIWREFETGFLPAAKAGNVAALSASLVKIREQYSAHRTVIDQIVERSTAYVEGIEKDSKANVNLVKANLIVVFSVLVSSMIAVIALLIFGIARPIKAIAMKIAKVADDMRQSAGVSVKQMELDLNLAELRNALAKHGVPRLVDAKLYFGDYLVNNETELVDKVIAQCNGFATIFVGDVRVATNLTDASGQRAIGTKLTSREIYDALFHDGVSFHGKAQILGRNFLAIYEPIFVDNKPVAALFIGVPLSENDDAAKKQVERNEIALMTSAYNVLHKAIEDKDKIERQALIERYHEADENRSASARTIAAATQQKAVVDSLTEALQCLAQNDLSHRIEADFPSEYRSLKVNFGRAAETLSQTVAALVAQGRAIFDISAELNEQADQLSHRTEQQAANLEQSTAALGEIAGSSKRSAEGAHHARTVVATANSDASRGAEVVKEAISAMRVIAASANEIAPIVGLIDEIAFQTNLLALNAGVEAARAGEAGKGFAVVASEVRALALRSTEAAKQIRDLIAASTAGVGRGVDLVSRTGDALASIVRQVAEISGVITEIANGAKEQAHALGEVSTAFSEMDQSTQANAVVAQRSSEAAKMLAAEAQRLNDLVARFRLEAPNKTLARPIAA